MIAIPDAAPRDRPVAIEISLRLEVPKLYRRIEFELSTEARHVARLRYRTLGLGASALTLRFRGTVMLDGAGAALKLEARPSRHFRRWDDRRGGGALWGDPLRTPGREDRRRPGRTGSGAGRTPWQPRRSWLKRHQSDNPTTTVPAAKA